MVDMKTKPVAIVATLAEGLELIRAFAHKLENSYNSYTWAILMQEDDGTFSYWERHSNPCYGEMRPYAKGNVDNGPYEPELMPESQRKVNKPGDLYWPFPKTGKPVLITVPWCGNVEWSELLEEVVLNPEVSPWKSVLKDIEIVYHSKKPKVVTGLVIKDTNIEPTVMVNMFRKIKNDISISFYNDTRSKFPDLSKLEAFVLSQIWHSGVVVNGEYGSVFGMNYSIKRIINGEPTNQTGGTFFERYAYDRPKVDWIFADTEDSFPKLFGGGGYSTSKATNKTVYDAFIKAARG